MSTVLGIDLGTQSVKVVFYDFDAREAGIVVACGVRVARGNRFVQHFGQSPVDHDHLGIGEPDENGDAIIPAHWATGVQWLHDAMWVDGWIPNAP